MDPRDFIDVAREIVDHVTQTSPKLAEAAIRTSISRLYYGILHWMQYRYAIVVPKTKVKTYHSHVISQLEQLLDDEILIDFHFMMKARVEADYYLSSNVELKSYKECAESVERILGIVESGAGRAFDAKDELRYYHESRNGKNRDRPPTRVNSPGKRTKK
ncbi:MAG: hypothetical protein Q6373_007880 [Candidatus Sigynarchaeota archaeon]